jgi:hypothetical protein
VETHSCEDALKLAREGKNCGREEMKGAAHVTRGLLEFQAGPTSPTHQPELGGNKKLVL